METHRYSGSISSAVECGLEMHWQFSVTKVTSSFYPSIDTETENSQLTVGSKLLLSDWIFFSLDFFFSHWRCCDSAACDNAIPVFFFFFNCVFQEQCQVDITENGVLLLIYWDKVHKVTMKKIWHTTWRTVPTRHDFKQYAFIWLLVCGRIGRSCVSNGEKKKSVAKTKKWCIRGFSHLIQATTRMFTHSRNLKNPISWECRLLRWGDFPLVFCKISSFIGAQFHNSWWLS